MQFVHSPYLGYASNNGTQPTSNQQTTPGLQYPSLEHQLSYHQATPGVQHQQQHHQAFPAEYAPQQMLSHGDSASTGGGPVKPKRKQVKNACVNCQKACKKCDDARPCPRCIKYGIEATCVNSVRKERKKGVKRGPYKQRKGQDADDASTSEPPTPVPGTLSSLSSPGNPMLNPYLRAFGDSYQPHQSTHVVSPYTVPPAIMQQMYQAEYQPTGSVKHQPASQQTQQQQPQQQQQQQQQQQSQQQTEGAGVKYKESSSAGADSDEEGSKLTILSQLCSAVLDHSDAPKEEAEQQQRYDNDNTTTAKKDQYTLLSGQPGYNIPAQQPTAGSRNFVYPSPNGNSSTQSSPSQMHPFYPSAAHNQQHQQQQQQHQQHQQQQQQHQQQQQQQQQVWPLPPLQSVIPSDRNVYYQQNPLQHTPQNQGNGDENWNDSTPQW